MIASIYSMHDVFVIHPLSLCVHATLISMMSFKHRGVVPFFTKYDGSDAPAAVMVAMHVMPCFTFTFTVAASNTSCVYSCEFCVCIF